MQEATSYYFTQCQFGWADRDGGGDQTLQFSKLERIDPAYLYKEQRLAYMGEKDAYMKIRQNTNYSEKTITIQ